MAAKQRSTVVGVFEKRERAEEAVRELKSAGFRDDQIGVTARGQEAAPGSSTGALIGAGIPEQEATYYERELQQGRTVVTVRCGSRCDQAQQVLRQLGAYDAESRGAGAQATGDRVTLREEQLTASKETVQTGEVEIGTRVVSEQRTIEVPVTREEVTIERTPVNRPADTPVGADMETVRVPIREERVEFEKRPVVTEEISVNKRQVQDVERRTETVKREEAVVDTSGGADVAGFSSWDEARPHAQSRWRERAGGQGGRWEEHEAPYRYGWEMARRPESRGKQWDELEPRWRQDWEANNAGHPWEKAKEGARDAWEWATGTQVRR